LLLPRRFRYQKEEVQFVALARNSQPIQ
jgi:hypothetical protein